LCFVQFKDYASVHYPMLCYMQCKEINPELRLLLSEYLLRVGAAFQVTHPALVTHLKDSNSLQQLLQVPTSFYSEKLRTVEQVAELLHLPKDSTALTVTAIVLKKYSEL